MSSPVIEFQESLAACADATSGFTIFEQAINNLAVVDVAYTCLAPISIDSKRGAGNVIFTTYSASMMRKMGGFQGYANDVTRIRAEMGLDTVWTDALVRNSATPIQNCQYELERAAGLRNGYTHVLGKMGDITATIGLRLDRLSGAEFQKDWPHLSKIILPMAQIMHRHCVNRHRMQKHKISACEKEMLSWLAMGLRPEEIADQLKIGYRSVDKYIVSAKNRLGAKSPDHAGARALAYGLLDI
jgi:DNA-binding CsgD family transcriptional regulator